MEIKGMYLCMSGFNDIFVSPTQETTSSGLSHELIIDLKVSVLIFFAKNIIFDKEKKDRYNFTKKSACESFTYIILR